MTNTQASLVLAKLAALLLAIDDLDRRAILWDASGRDHVLEMFHRSQPLLMELIAADPVIFAQVPVRESVEFAPAGARDILRILRRDVLYALELGSQVGLCKRDMVMPPVSGTPHAKSARLLRKILVGVTIAVLGTIVVYSLHLR